MQGGQRERCLELWRDTGCTSAQPGGEVRNEIPEDLSKWEQRAKPSKMDWK